MQHQENEQQEAEESPEKEQASDRLNRSIKQALLAGVCLLVFVAPDFVFNVLKGNVDLGLLAHEVGQRVHQLQSLFASRPAPMLALRHAIIGQESGGEHALLNASGSGAMGLGQIMPENLSQWSQEALGREISRSEFLNNPDLQLAIIDFKLKQYWDEAIRQARGNEDEAVMRVASWWYSGDPDLFTDTRPQYWGADEYPSIAEYCQSVLDRFKRQRGDVL